MTYTSPLFEEAENSLDKCDNFAARSAYRQAALIKCPSDIDLDNLALAEEGERRDYRRTLIEKYPDSLDVLLDYVKRIHEARNFRLAVRRCDELLERPTWSPGVISGIRYHRMSAVIAGGSHAMLSQSALQDDFFYRLRSSLECGARHAVVRARQVGGLNRQAVPDRALGRNPGCPKRWDKR
jgi:hypothetical protein